MYARPFAQSNQYTFFFQFKGKSRWFNFIWSCEQPKIILVSMLQCTSNMRIDQRYREGNNLGLDVDEALVSMNNIDRALVGTDYID